MSANSIRLAVMVLVAACVAACGAKDPVATAPVTRPVKLFVVEGATLDAVRSFPGRVDATQSAELAFRVSGLVRDILVREGDMVESDQVLARLDPTDFQIVLEDRQASFDNARSNFERAKELIVDGNISRMDFDRMEASYRTASAALSQAVKDLEYTIMRSPFRGRIAERKVERFEEVPAKKPIFTLQNIEQLDVIIDLPESVIRMVSGGGQEGEGVSLEGLKAGAERSLSYVSFEGRAGEQFPLLPKEVVTKANEQTQTFKATFTMESPDDFTVLPGMTATVTLDLSEVLSNERAKWVPVRAVQADSGLKPRVWVLDADTMIVSSREVTIGRMSGDRIQVTEGLAGGEEIVAVGAPYLAEGMRVSRMALSEQAVPREDDPS